MELKVGDKVSFLNEANSGEITKIVDKDTVLVNNEDGFEIPVLKSELILQKAWNPDATYSQPQDEESGKVVTKHEPEEEEETEIFYSDSTDVNLYLAFVPKNQKSLTSDGFDVYLINDSNFFLQYNLSYTLAGEYNLLKGELEPNIKYYLTDISRDLISDDLELFFQTLFFDKKEFLHTIPLTQEIRVKAAKLFKVGAYKTNDFFDELALVLTLSEDNAMNKVIKQLDDKEFVEKIIQSKRPARKMAESKPHSKETKKSYKEVDLHIHELLDDETGLTDNDKREYQIDKFKEEMDAALKDGKIKKIVFIHGVGGGRLKHDIRRELQRKYKKCLYQDASFAEYGYGATMVVLRK